MIPSIFQPDFFSDLPAEDLENRLCNSLGKIKTHEELNEAVRLLPSVDDSKQTAVVRAALAREFYLMAACGECTPDEAPGALLAVRPFRDSPSLSSIVNHSAAAAVFPCDGDSAAGMQVWVTREDAKNTTYFAGGGSRELNGSSYRLAEKLAERALGEPDVKRNLASDWIISGDVDESGAVRAVDIGNKLTMATNRQWMLPLGNREDVEAQYDSIRRRPRLVRRLDAAWAMVSGKGFSDADCPVPDHLDVLFSFVSRNRFTLPLMASRLRPGRILLWHSEDEEHGVQRAKQVCSLLAELVPESEVLPPRQLQDAGDLQSVFKEIRKELEQTVGCGESACFSLTNATWLMRYAALTACSFYPEIPILYQPENADREHPFHWISNELFPPATGGLDLRGVPEDMKHILLERDEGQEAVEDILEKIRNFGKTSTASASEGHEENPERKSARRKHVSAVVDEAADAGSSGAGGDSAEKIDYRPKIVGEHREISRR
jgi:hypothetical protein